jgi:lauroyl/myristoyl acyltransferase
MRGEKRRIAEAVQAVFGPEESRWQTDRRLAEIVRGILMHYYEKLFNAMAPVETLKTFLTRAAAAEGLEAIAHGLARGHGVLLVTGHYGGVEFLPGFMALSGLPVSIIVRFGSSRLREASLHKADRCAGLVHLIDADESPNVLRAIFRDLEANRVVITQCDEIDAWRPSAEQSLTFLRRRILMDRTINCIARRAPALVVFGAMHRCGPSRYRLIISSTEGMAQAVAVGNELPIGALVLKFIERYIYAFPEQWYLWSKYSRMKAVQAPVSQVLAPLELHRLEPSLGRL